MQDANGMSLDKNVLVCRSAMLGRCPFCGGKAEYYLAKNDKAPLCIRHVVASGVNCPARWFDQHCESYEQGKLWWNGRAG